MERGADLCLEVEGKTPLYLAFEQSKWDVVNWLRARMPNHAEIEKRWKEEGEKALKSKAEPDHERAEEIKNIGNKFYIAKEYAQALEEYGKALTFDPQNVEMCLCRKLSTGTLPLASWPSSSTTWPCSIAKRPRRKTQRTSRLFTGKPRPTWA